MPPLKPPATAVAKDDDLPPGTAVPIILIEAETGLTKEVIRKWESRYGFPQPGRDANGDRIFPAEQVARLRLIQRLLGAGLRPGKIVGMDIATLERLTDEVAQGSSPPTDGARLVLDALTRHDSARLTDILKGQLNRQGLSMFAKDTVASLNTIVGDAWFRGEIRIYEEHLYAETVSDILRESIRTVTNLSGSPRLLLTTAPGELHTIGLLLANAVAALEDACCIRLGAQTPAADIVTAVKDCRIDIVGLSFSAAYPGRDAARFLRDLRTRIDPAVGIWAGGGGVANLRRMEGVSGMTDLDGIGPAIRAWRRRCQPGLCHRQP